MSQFIRIKHLCRFIFKERKMNLFVTAGFVLIVVAVLILVKTGKIDLNNFGQLDSIIGIATFLVAGIIWFGEINQAWENSLPKRLTVEFLYKNQRLIFCEEAYLASESDIRAWGQQIGAQMTGNSLRFLPSIKQKPGRIKESQDGAAYKLYEVKFTLTELPVEKPADKTIFKENDNKYLYWSFKKGKGGADMMKPEWRTLNDRKSGL